MTLEQLSEREKEVAALLMEGKSNKQIASALHISPSTVEFHLRNIYNKAGVSSRVELIIKLRDSTVASEAKIPQNKTGRNLTDFVTDWKNIFSRMVRESPMNNVFNPNAGNPSSSMTFFESIRVCLTKYAEFRGRASRPEFWWFALFVVLVGTAFQYLSQTAAAIFLLAVLLPFLAVGARRLKDAGKSAWLLFYLLVPVGGIVALGFLWAMPPVSEPEEDAVPL